MSAGAEYRDLLLQHANRPDASDAIKLDGYFVHLRVLSSAFWTWFGEAGHENKSMTRLTDNIGLTSTISAAEGWASPRVGWSASLGLLWALGQPTIVVTQA